MSFEVPFKGMPDFIKTIPDELKVIHINHRVNSYQIDCLKRYMNFLHTSNPDQVIHWCHFHTLEADMLQLGFLTGVDVELQNHAFRQILRTQLDKYETCFLVLSNINDWTLIDKYLDLQKLKGTIVFITEKPIQHLTNHIINIHEFNGFSLPEILKKEITNKSIQHVYEFLKTLEIFNTALFPKLFIIEYLKFLGERKLISNQLKIDDLKNTEIFDIVTLDNEEYFTKNVMIKKATAKKHIAYLRCALKSLQNVFLQPNHINLSSINSYYQSLALGLLESDLVKKNLKKKKINFSDVILLVQISNRCARIYCWQGLWDIGLKQMEKSIQMLDSKKIKPKSIPLVKFVNDEIRYLSIRMKLGAGRYSDRDYKPLQETYAELALNFEKANNIHYHLVCEYSGIIATFFANESDRTRELLQAFINKLNVLLHQNKNQELNDLAYYSHLLGQCLILQAVIAFKSGNMGYEEASNLIDASIQEFDNTKYFPYLSPYKIFALQFRALCFIYMTKFVLAEGLINTSDSLLEKFEKELYSNSYITCRKLREENILLKKFLYRECGDIQKLTKITEEYDRSVKINVKHGFIVECEIETLIPKEFLQNQRNKYISNMTIADLRPHYDEIKPYAYKDGATIALLGGFGTGKSLRVIQLIRKLEMIYANQNVLYWSINAKNQMSFIDSFNKLLSKMKIKTPKSPFENIADYYIRLCPELKKAISIYRNVVILFDNIKTSVLKRFFTILKYLSSLKQSGLYVIFTGDSTLENVLPKGCSTIRTDNLSYKNSLLVLHQYGEISSVNNAITLIQELDYNLTYLTLAAKTIHAIPEIRQSANPLEEYRTTLLKSYCMIEEKSDTQKVDCSFFDDSDKFISIFKFFIKSKEMYSREYESLFYFLSFIGSEQIPLKLIKHFLIEMAPYAFGNDHDHVISLKVSKTLMTLNPIIYRTHMMLNYDDDLYSINEAVQQGLQKSLRDIIHDTGDINVKKLLNNKIINVYALSDLLRFCEIFINAIEKTTTDQKFKEIIILHADFFLDKLKIYNHHPEILKGSLSLISHIGIKLFYMGEYMHALTHLSDLKKINLSEFINDRNFDLLIKAHIKLANIYIRIEQFYEVIPICEKINSLANVSVHHQISNLSVYATGLQMNGKILDALKYLTDKKWDKDFLKSKMDIYFRWQDTIISCHFFNGDLDKVISIATTIIDEKRKHHQGDDPNLCNTLAFCGAAHYMKDEYPKAEKLTYQMINILNDKITHNISAHQCLIRGIVLVEVGQFAEGLLFFNKIKELSKKNPRNFILVETRSAIIYARFRINKNNFMYFLILKEIHELINNILEIFRLNIIPEKDKLIEEFKLLQAHIKNYDHVELEHKYFKLIYTYKVAIYGQQHPYAKIEEKRHAYLSHSGTFSIISSPISRSKSIRKLKLSTTSPKTNSNSHSHITQLLEENRMPGDLIKDIKNNRIQYQKMLTTQHVQFSEINDLNLPDYQLLTEYSRINHNDFDNQKKRALFTTTLSLVKLDCEYYKLRSKLFCEYPTKNITPISTDNLKYHSSIGTHQYHFEEQHFEEKEWCAMYAAGFDEPALVIEELVNQLHQPIIVNYIRRAIFNNYYASISLDEPFFVEGSDADGCSIFDNIINHGSNCDLSTYSDMQNNFMRYIERPMVQRAYLHTLLETKYADANIVAACLSLQGKKLALLIDYQLPDKSLVNYCEDDIKLEDDNVVKIIYHPNAGFYSPHYNALKLLAPPIQKQKVELSPQKQDVKGKQRISGRLNINNNNNESNQNNPDYDIAHSQNNFQPS